MGKKIVGVAAVSLDGFIADDNDGVRPLFDCEEFVAPEPFDAAVATLSLHHIADLEAADAKIAGLVIPGGTFVAGR